MLAASEHGWLLEVRDLGCNNGLFIYVCCPLGSLNFRTIVVSLFPGLSQIQKGNLHEILCKDCL